MKKSPAKIGRPRNPELDKLQREAGVTRRHAARLLKEMSGNIATPAKSSDALPPSPTGFARLAKLLKETELLEQRIERAKLEARVRAGELLEVSTAIEIYGKPHQTAGTMLGGMPKQIAPRLVGQPVREIERTLAEWCDTLAAQIFKTL